MSPAFHWRLYLPDCLTCISVCICVNYKYKLQLDCLFSTMKLLESTVNKMWLLMSVDSSILVHLLNITLVFFFALLFNTGTYCLGHMQLCGVIFPNLFNHLLDVSESCPGKHWWKNSGM